MTSKPTAAPTATPSHQTARVTALPKVDPTAKATDETTETPPTLTIVPTKPPRFTFVPGKTSGPGHFSLDDIPADVKEEVEEAYKMLRGKDGRLHMEFKDKAELDQYVKWVTAYCAVRPAGEIRFRKSPVKKQPENHMDFRITDLQEAAA